MLFSLKSKLLSVAVIACLLSSSITWAKHPLCKTAEMPLTLMTPKGLEGFLNQYSAFKDIGEAVCCLPKVVREGVVVAFNSKAGQEGRADSPRVFLFNPDDRSTIISLNGGDIQSSSTEKITVSQGHNLEMMYTNPKTLKQELYDYEFTEKHGRKMSGPNPEACMACHGDDSGRTGGGGARTLFESLAGEWPKFVDGAFLPKDKGGLLDCSGASMEAEIRLRLSEISKKAFLSNPRFKCLKFPENSMLGGLDQALSIMSEESFVRSLSSTRDYQKFQYAILGEFAGCIEPEGLESFEAWIPRSELSKMKDETYIAKEIRESTTARQACLRMANKALTEQKVIHRRQSAALQLIKAGKVVPIVLDETPFLCESSVSPEELCEDSSDEPPFTIYDKFVSDQYFRPTRVTTPGASGTSESFNSTIRFLFESRGLDASHWSMSPSMGRYLRGGHFYILEDEFLKIRKSGWKIDYDALVRARHKDDRTESGESPDIRQACSELAALSLAQFRGPASVVKAKNGKGTKSAPKSAASKTPLNPSK